MRIEKNMLRGRKKKENKANKKKIRVYVLWIVRRGRCRADWLTDWLTPRVSTGRTVTALASTDAHTYKPTESSRSRLRPSSDPSSPSLDPAFASPFQQERRLRSRFYSSLAFSVFFSPLSFHRCCIPTIYNLPVQVNTAIFICVS